jgi:hypothetical protein
VLARARRPAPIEAEGVHVVLGRGCVGRHLARSDLGPGGVVDLDAGALGCRWAGERLGASACLSGHLDAPPAEVVSELELDLGELDAEDVRLCGRSEDRESSARSSMKNPATEFCASPAQILPSKAPSMTTVKSSSDTSP